MAGSTTTTTVAKYLFTRLRQLDVGSVFGVPGDYNLVLLDSVEPSGLTWIGTCNELNAGYAADAYSRLKGLGALITTFGVGELSAINAIAGAYAELAPVVHIVGTPRRIDQTTRALVHHTLKDGEYGRFAKMQEQVTVAQVDLKDPRQIPEQIDWVLGQCLLHSRPVYIMLPDDLAEAEILSTRLAEKIATPVLPFVSDSKYAARVDDICAKIVDRIHKSQKPAIIVDGETRPCRTVDLVHEIVARSKWPTFTTGFGKSLIDESLPNFYGVYSGRMHKFQKEYVDSADLVLCFGPHFTKTNTYLSSSIPPAGVTISFSPTSVMIDNEEFVDLPARQFLSLLLTKIDFTQISPESLSGHSPNLKYTDDLDIDPYEAVDPSSLLDHGHMWHRFQPLLQPGDIVLGETGTPTYGIRCFKMPARSRFFTMATWLSIGYMLPAALGAAVAQRENIEAQSHLENASNHAPKVNGSAAGPASGSSQPRTYCFIGDGSLQMTVQEISTMIRLDLPVSVIVINNDGYTVERCIHGKDQKYNDVAMWNYTFAPQFFDRKYARRQAKVASNHQQDMKSDKNENENVARTYAELDRLVQTWVQKRESDNKNGEPDESNFQILEVVLDKEDGPKILRNILKLQQK